MPVADRPAAPWEHEIRRNSRQVLWMARISFVLVGSLPWWLPLIRAYLPIEPVGEVLDTLFILVCHRLPARTLELAGVLMPLCSRCGGIFAGLALGAALCWPRTTLRQAKWGLAIGGLLMLIDVVTQDLGVHPVWHPARIATGMILGWVASSALMAAIKRERGLI